MPRFAHLSDLHLGSSARFLERARALCRALLREGVEAVLVSGDVTHRGRRAELAAFREAFAPLLEQGRVAVVPGNHDRMTDDVGPELMGGPPVQVSDLGGLHLVRLDSTAPHNRDLHRGHGVVGEHALDDLAERLDEGPPGALRVLMLHHHPTPLPVEDLAERLTCWLGLPWCAELRAGPSLLERLRGRCDLLLHGHRHVPAEHTAFADGPRPLGVFNAGSSTGLGRVRIFEHQGGVLAGVPRWQAA